MNATKKIQKKLAKAIEYLKSIGCKEIILFGSVVDGKFNKYSDIDLAVSGISPEKFFEAVVDLPSIVNHKVDLITLDYISEDIGEKIRKEGEFIFAT